MAVIEPFVFLAVIGGLFCTRVSAKKFLYFRSTGLGIVDLLPYVIICIYIPYLFAPEAALKDPKTTNHKLLSASLMHPTRHPGCRALSQSQPVCKGSPNGFKCTRTFENVRESYPTLSDAVDPRLKGVSRSPRDPSDANRRTPIYTYPTLSDAVDPRLKGVARSPHDPSDANRR